MGAECRLGVSGPAGRKRAQQIRANKLPLRPRPSNRPVVSVRGTPRWDSSISDP
jgi:hypothetical protein